MKVVIIGGVAAGAATATRLKREMPSAEIVIFEKSSKISFANCGLPYGIGGSSNPDALAPKDTSSMEARGIEVHTLTEVIEIKEDSKEVIARDLKTSKTSTHKFDKLVVATGARALKLPIKGLEDEQKAYSLRTYDDMQKIIQNLDGVKNVLVIGGGFIGVEMAENFIEKEINVHLVELKEKLAGFDYDFSSFLEEKLRTNGVKLHLGKSVDEIKTDSKKFVIGDEEFDYDMIITTGITPNTEILNGTSVVVDAKGIVETNKYMQTKNKDIYAAGDIVYTPHVITNKKVYMPLARQAKSQGRLIADHIAGIKTKGQYPTTGATGFVLFGQEFAKVGFSEAATKFVGIKHRIVMATVASNAPYTKAEKLIMKMIFAEKGQKLIGLQATGKNAAKAVDTFATALTAGMDIYDLERLNLIYQPHISTTLNPLNTIAQIAINELRIGFSSECPMHIVREETGNKIIDIRDAKQHEEKGHLNGAINIPTKDLSIETVGPDMEQQIVVHCNSGFGASLAARKLVELGYKNVRNAYGGNNMYQLMLKK